MAAGQWLILVLYIAFCLAGLRAESKPAVVLSRLTRGTSMPFFLPSRAKSFIVNAACTVVGMGTRLGAKAPACQNKMHPLSLHTKVEGL